MSVRAPRLDSGIVGRAEQAMPSTANVAGEQGMPPVTGRPPLTASAVESRDRATRATGWALSPGQRKLTVAAHVILSVGLLGVSTVLFVLAAVAAVAAVAATTADAEASRAAYRSMGILTSGVTQAGAVGALATGLILSFGTKWGVFQYYWIVTKLVLTAATVLNGMVVVGGYVRQASALTSGSAPRAAELGSVPTLLVAATGAGVLMLGAATVISVYKPWGAIRPAGRARRGRPATERSTV